MQMFGSTSCSVSRTRLFAEKLDDLKARPWLSSFDVDLGVDDLDRARPTSYQELIAEQDTGARPSRQDPREQL